jgi:beta-glucanase (GH16 family)
LTPHKNNKVTTNLIWSGFTNWGETVQNFDPAQNWHEYEFTWTPDYVAFAIDGNEVRREDHTSERAENGVNAGVEDLNKD